MHTQSTRALRSPASTTLTGVATEWSPARAAAAQRATREPRRLRAGARTRQALLCLSLLSLGTSAALAAAPGTVSDAAGDFLPSYTGVQAGDLDVLSSSVVLDAADQTLSFNAELAAPVGTTAGALYVWGLNRGAGTERFASGSPSVGQGVAFDGVLIVRPDGTGQFNDLITGTQTALAAGSVKISGNTVSAVDLPATLFPSQGLALADYTWNLWPRLGLGNNAQISDFAPDASNAPLAISPVPEAGSQALLLGGLLLLHPWLQRQRGRTAQRG